VVNFYLKFISILTDFTDW